MLLILSSTKNYNILVFKPRQTSIIIDFLAILWETRPILCFTYRRVRIEITILEFKTVDVNSIFWMTTISIPINSVWIKYRPYLKVNCNNGVSAILWNDSFGMTLLWRKKLLTLEYAFICLLYIIEYVFDFLKIISFMIRTTRFHSTV